MAKSLEQKGKDEEEMQLNKNEKETLNLKYCADPRLSKHNSSHVSVILISNPGTRGESAGQLNII